MSDPERIRVDGDRHYRIDGNAYPSVTTVLNQYGPKQDAIQGWREKMRRQGKDPDDVRDRAALLGTLAHHRILNDYAIRPLPLPEVDMSMVDDQLETDIETCELLWETLDYDLGQSPYIEEKLYSHEYGFAGTADVITTGPNEAATVVDLKTSGGIHDSYRMQVAAYRAAAREMPSMPDPDHGAIIRLDPDPETNPEMVPKVELLRPAELDDWFGAFVGLLDSY